MITTRILFTQMTLIGLKSDELNFELKNKIDQGAFVLCLNKIRGEI